MKVCPICGSWNIYYSTAGCTSKNMGTCLKCGAYVEPITVVGGLQESPLENLTICHNSNM